jgi:histidine ammonia-lyase
VGDNPLFLPEDHVVLTGANFQGTPVSLPLDTLGAAITMISVLSERRMNRLTNPALSAGLPPFLTKGAGMFSGMMLSQYTADMQIVEQKALSAPSFIQSIPAAADQEDFVSMGMNSSLQTRQILDIACGVLGIELMAAAQALDMREFQAGAGTRAARDAVRRRVEYLDVDRPLHSDHNRMLELVRKLEVLEAVESEIGELATY